MGRVELTQPGSGKGISVDAAHAEFWRGLGYRDRPKPRAKKAGPEKPEAEKG